MSVLDDETEWCKAQLETIRRNRGDSNWKCSCWAICTDACKEVKDSLFRRGDFESDNNGELEAGRRE